MVVLKSRLKCSKRKILILEIYIYTCTQIIKYKTLPRVNDLYTSFVGSHDGASQHIISYCEFLNVHNYMKSGADLSREKTSRLERK